MRGRVLLGGAIATFLVVGVLAPPTPVNAQSEEEQIEDIADHLRDLERQIEDAGNERSEIAAQILEVQGRMAAMLEILVEAEQALREVEGAIGGKEAEIAELQRKARILETQIADTQLNQQLTHIQIRDRAVELYMNGSGGLGNLAFGVDDVQSASVSMEYAGNIVANTGVLLRSLEVLENQEHTQQAILDEDQARQGEVLASLEIDRVEAEAHRATVDASRAEIQIEINAVEALLAEVNAEIDAFESHIGALERESKELENEIARRQIREGTAPGRLAFPVPGAVTSPFGWRLHPIFGTRKLHAGIDMDASSGQSIRAAGNGTVIMATTWGGYGRTVIIDHGGGLSSLYAHQSSINVSLGAEVNAGDVIGYVGCSGYCTGAHLHFETREYGAPVDPMKYLNG